MVKLSILIATMPSRSEKLKNLMFVLQRQLTPEVELITDISMEYNIGVKRNKMLIAASGKYVVFIDDDDLISWDYVKKILEAMESNPDCIGISGVITTNGGNEQQWHISKDFGSWYEQNRVYYRTPNHISPVKLELALKAGFPDTRFGEDYAYSMALLPFLKTEIRISGNLYFYRYEQKKVHR